MIGLARGLPRCHHRRGGRGLRAYQLGVTSATGPTRGSANGTIFCLQHAYALIHPHRGHYIQELAAAPLDRDGYAGIKDNGERYYGRAGTSTRGLIL